MNTNQHDLSDEEFDDLFRNAADKIDLDFDADSWKKMSQKLDAVSPPTSTDDKTSTSWLKWGLPVLGLLLLLSIGSYFAIEYSSKKPATNQPEFNNGPAKQPETNGENAIEIDKVDSSTPESTIDKVVSEKPAKEKSINSSNPITSLNKKTDKTKAVSKVPAKVEKASTAEQNQASTNSLLPGKSERNNEIQRKNVSKETNQLAKKEEGAKANETPEASVNQVATNNVKADNAPLLYNTPIVTDNQEALNRWELTGANALSSKAVNYKINLSLPEIAFESPVMAPMAPVRENTLFNKGFSLRLALSPDFSTVGLTDIVKVGHNWAVLGEYRFNKRLSIQTGIIKSLKYYSALSESYELPYSGTYTPAIKDIDATCNMLDIPLNLRYDLSQRPNNRWFVSGGFTSYVMLNEKYNYNYQDPTNPNIKWWKWEGKTGAYPFSVFNLSLGFEQQLFRRLSFQVQPFLKMPLGKVGYGKVRLATAGVFFSLKYPLTKF